MTGSGKQIGRQAGYRIELESIGSDPEVVAQYLSSHSNLPGPRGNLELAHAFADWAPAGLVDALAASDDEYLLFCAVLGLGQRLALAEDPGLVATLRGHAIDVRWRIREAVATALQRVGDHDLPRLCQLTLDWVGSDDAYVIRAAAAAICEPRLLQDPQGSATALLVCQRATDWLLGVPTARRRDPAVRTLRQALGYCWSVAVAADPPVGIPAFAALQESPDADVRWVVRENLSKSRLQRVLTPQVR